jgi:hypothetical protein
MRLLSRVIVIAISILRANNRKREGERKRESVDENGEFIVTSIPRDDGEPEGRPFSVRRVSVNVGSAAAQNDLLISTASQWRIGQLHEGSPDTTPARKEPRGLSQREGCNSHGIVRGSGERCCSLSHSRKLWWNDEGRWAAVFCHRRPLLLPLESRRKANIPFDHTEGIEKSTIRLACREQDANFRSRASSC